MEYEYGYNEYAYGDQEFVQGGEDDLGDYDEYEYGDYEDNDNVDIDNVDNDNIDIENYDPSVNEKDIEYVNSIKAYERINRQRSVLEQILTELTLEDNIEKILSNIGKYNLSKEVLSQINLSTVINDVNNLPKINIKIPNKVRDNLILGIQYVKYGSTKNPLGIVLGYLSDILKFEQLVSISEMLPNWGVVRPDIVRYIKFYKESYLPTLHEHKLYL